MPRSRIIQRGKPFQRDPDATQGGQQHHEGDARHAGDPFRGHHQGQHQGNLLPDREVNTVQGSSDTCAAERTVRHAGCDREIVILRKLR